MTERFDKVAVLGAGTMGRGIAQVAAATGSRVALVDRTQELADKGRASIDAALARLVEKGKLPEAERAATLARIEAVSDRKAALEGADVVVEAAPEDLALKQSVFKECAKVAPAHALLGTNTSSLSITAIARSTGAEERVIGLHFFN